MDAAERDYVAVVTGVPRSGTSLLMQMLAAGGMPLLCDDLRPPDRHNPRGYWEYEPVKRLRRDASWLPQALGRAVKVAHALVPALPRGWRYRVVLVRRDLREVIASQEAMLAERAGAAPEGPAAPRLAAIFEEQLAELEAWASARPERRLLRLEHRELLERPRCGAEALGAFLGGGLDLAAMAAAVEPALHRRRVG